MGWFGASIKRKEDPAFLTGRGRYVDDIALPGMLHAAVLRSPHGHAAIRGIDKRAALSLPGVHAVFTHADCRNRCSARPCRCSCRAPPSSRR
jgi:carbon-monoxide dehydrogenase large subunit